MLARLEAGLATIESILANDVTLGSVDVPGLAETPPAPTLLVERILAEIAFWRWRQDRLAVVGMNISTLTADGDRLKTEYCDSQVLVDGAGQVIAEGMAVSVAKEAESMTEIGNFVTEAKDRAKTDRAKGRRRR